MTEGKIHQHAVATEQDLFAGTETYRLRPVSVHGYAALVGQMAYPGRPMEHFEVQPVQEAGIVEEIISDGRDHTVMEIPVVAEHIVILVGQLETQMPAMQDLSGERVLEDRQDEGLQTKALAMDGQYPDEQPGQQA
jgi:hypothetical protein